LYGPPNRNFNPSQPAKVVRWMAVEKNRSFTKIYLRLALD